jgi:hypothetical protein
MRQAGILFPRGIGLLAEPTPKQILVRAIMNCHIRGVALSLSVTMVDCVFCGDATELPFTVRNSVVKQLKKARFGRPNAGRRQRDCAMHKPQFAVLYESGMVTLPKIRLAG